MRIFVDKLAAGELTVTGDEHHYVMRVRRARVGDELELVDGSGRRARAVITRIAGDHTVLSADPAEAIVEPAPRVRVLVPLIKGDRMDACLEKLVEVGADELVVWAAARSVVKLDEARRESRIAHYQAIAQAAARQSGRAHVPAVTYAPFAHAIAGITAGVVLDPNAERAPFPPDDVITIISGPEGGFAPEELDALSAWTHVGLGPSVLRADTAPIVAVALLRGARASG